MKPEERVPFADIDPVPGGVERFRTLLESGGNVSHEPVTRWVTAGGVVAALAIAAIAAIAVLAPDYAIEPQETIAFESPEFDRLLGRPMQQVETTVKIDDEPVTLSAIPVKTPGIRIYEVRKN